MKKTKLCCILAKMEMPEDSVYCSRCLEVWCKDCYHEYETEKTTHKKCGGDMWWMSAPEYLVLRR